MASQRRGSSYHSARQKPAAANHSGKNSPRAGSVYGGSRHAPRVDAGQGYGGMDNYLQPPQRARSRGASLPGNMNLLPEQLYTLRNFSMTGKNKVVNRGDSLKSAKSQHSINSTGSSADQRYSTMSNSRTNSGEDLSGASSRASSRAPSRRNSRAPSRKNSEKPAHNKRLSAAGGVAAGPVREYRVAMVGANNVGKSALASQFLSSEHINTYDSVENDVRKVVCLSVDDKESRLVIIDHRHGECALENQVSSYRPEGYMVVFAVDDEKSLEMADEMLTYLKDEMQKENKSVILVANKTDLVRSRIISANSGRSLAIRHGCKYIETSPGINHNVDELLVGMLAQIQLRQDFNNASSAAPSGEKESGFKVLAYLEKVLKMSNSKNKSCGNLHVL